MRAHGCLYTAIRLLALFAVALRGEGGVQRGVVDEVGGDGLRAGRVVSPVHLRFVLSLVHLHYQTSKQSDCPDELLIVNFS